MAEIVTVNPQSISNGIISNSNNSRLMVGSVRFFNQISQPAQSPDGESTLIELLSQPMHDNLNGVERYFCIPTGQTLSYLCLVDHTPCVLQQYFQNSQLARRQFQRHIV